MTRHPLYADVCMLVHGKAALRRSRYYSRMNNYHSRQIMILRSIEMTLVWAVAHGVSFCLPPNLAVYQATYGSYFSQYQANRSSLKKWSYM